MYVLGPELISQTDFPSGFAPAWWDDGAQYLSDGQVTLVGSIEGGTHQLMYGVQPGYPLVLEQNAQYLLTFDLFGEGLIGFGLGDVNTYPASAMYVTRASVPMRRTSVILTCVWNDGPDNPNNSLSIFPIYSVYATMNNFSLKKILGTSSTTGIGGHVDFKATFGETDNLLINGEFSPTYGDPFAQYGGWTNNGTWTWDSTKNGRIMHAPGGGTGSVTQVMSFDNLYNYPPYTTIPGQRSFIGTYLLYFEYGGNAGSFTINIGGIPYSPTFTIPPDQTKSYTPNSGWPDGMGVVFMYENGLYEDGTFTLTPSDDFDGWVDNVMVHQIAVILD